jgi:hypothetical protein
MKPRNASSDSLKDFQPSDLMAYCDWLFEQHQCVRIHEANKILTGLLLGTPTTASTQATGDGATVWRINISAGIITVGGVMKEFAAAVDTVIHDTTELMNSGKSCLAAILAKNVTGTITVVSVKGVVATTGAQLPPTDAIIQTAVGAGNSYVVLGTSLLNRTADTVVTQSQDNTGRPALGINIDTTFGNAASLPA